MAIVRAIVADKAINTKEEYDNDSKICRSKEKAR